MNTPPPDCEFKVEPLPSMSMPLLTPTSPQPHHPRPRRHTITRPDSALGFLSDSEDDQDSQALDRMSDILTNLIQEANNAVRTSRPRRSHPLSTRRQRPVSTSTSHLAHATKRSASLVPPRPSSYHARVTPPAYHHRPPSSASSTSPPLFSPRLPNTQSPVSSPSSVDGGKKTRAPSSALCPSPSMPSNQPASHGHPIKQLHTHVFPADEDALPPSLAESYRRLDSSMALVDSLSRDLAKDPAAPAPPPGVATSSLPFLLLPLLHIPHVLLTSVFDTLSIPTTVDMYTSSLSGMMSWAFFFALANLVITWSPATADSLPPITARPADPNASRASLSSLVLGRDRRLSLPGSFHPVSLPLPDPSSLEPLLQRPQRPAPINTAIISTLTASPLVANPSVRRPMPSTSYTRRLLARRVVPSRKRIIRPVRQVPCLLPIDTRSSSTSPSTPLTCQRRRSI
ncbi:hypothetical protein DM01DRAFT_1379895 [Hesseltinella vesiculosa]|uniref:Uncharacterized protein n=1 Tax=Hesseltinella vesiculosa TaxID=101127 RepID=A0A1X2GVI1_9FUNG|nr:hypothetical protein DM01DRAFT_1379895 [Hesseltinella vesiculosa]